MLQHFTRNKITFYLSVCAILLTAWTQASFSQTNDISSVAIARDQDKTADKIPLRILYVGQPDTDRQKEFVGFLSRYFAEVKTLDSTTFTEKQTENCDVVIFDEGSGKWNLIRGDMRLSKQYSRATITIGIQGAEWSGFIMRLKTGYM